MLTAMARCAKRRLTHSWVTIRIACKWRRDVRFLPLTHEHRELYDIIHRLCWRELRDFPDLVDCRDFNDRIQWLKLFDQDPEIIRCSDKIRVRDYVRERIGEEYLTKLHQCHTHFDNIDFESLPKSFVIKTNHDSGNVILVDDSDRLDRAGARQRVVEAMAQPYGWRKGEWAYSYISPKVFIEQFLSTGEDKAPADFKFHCVDGSVMWLQYIYDRDVAPKECIVDWAGGVTDIHFDHNMTHSENFCMPSNWSELIAVAEELAAGHKYVRVDLYSLNSCIKFGEMTFFPLMGCYKTIGQRELGGLMEFDRSTYKTPVTGYYVESTHPNNRIAYDSRDIV